MTSDVRDTPTLSRSLAGRLRAFKNKLLSSPRFQRAAVAFPLTRPIARSNAGALFNLCTGFVHSQVLLACVQLKIFQMLRAGPMAADEVAVATDLHVEAAERLLKAAASLDLLSVDRTGRYTLGDLGAALMGNPSVLAMIRHHGEFYKDLADPVALLRDRGAPTHLSRFWGYAGASDPATDSRESAPDYSELMATTQDFIAREVLSRFDMGEFRHLMDVGGGAGAFLIAAGQANPHLQLTLCDLPAVAEIGGPRLTAAGLGPRASAKGCDVFSDLLPTGADLISLVRILHDHDDGPALEILRSVRRALPAGGTLLIAEPMAGTRGAEAMGDAYFGLYLWAMGSGRARRKDELVDMLRAAGFSRMREVKSRQPLLVRMISAQ